MNQDKPKFNKKQQKKIELICLFTELNQSKRELHDIYSKGFKSSATSKNPLSSLINAVWVDNENEILKTALSKIDRSCWGPLAFDGFQSTQKIDPKILNSEFIKWTEKPGTGHGKGITAKWCKTRDDRFRALGGAEPPRPDWQSIQDTRAFRSDMPAQPTEDELVLPI